MANPQQAPKVPLKMSSPMSGENEGVQMAKSILRLPMNIVKAVFNPLSAPKIITDLIPKTGPLKSLTAGIDVISSPLKAGISKLTGAATGGAEKVAVAAADSAMSAGIKGLNAAGGATESGGKAIASGGDAVMKIGSKASATAIGSIIGVPLSIIGATVKGTGLAVQGTGKALKLTAKVLKLLQPFIKMMLKMAIKVVKLALKLAKAIARTVRKLAELTKRTIRATVRPFKGAKKIAERKRKTFQRNTAGARSALGKVAHVGRMARYRGQQIAHVGRTVRYRFRQVTAIPRSIVRRGTHVFKAGTSALKKVAVGANAVSDSSTRFAQGDLTAVKDAVTAFKSTGVRGHLKGALQKGAKDTKPTRPIRPTFKKSGGDSHGIAGKVSRTFKKSSDPDKPGIVKATFQATKKVLKGTCKMTMKPFEPIRMSGRAAQDLKARACAPVNAVKALTGSHEAMGQGDLSKAISGVQGAVESGSQVAKSPSIGKGGAPQAPKPGTQAPSPKPTVIRTSPTGADTTKKQPK